MAEKEEEFQRKLVEKEKEFQRKMEEKEEGQRREKGKLKLKENSTSIPGKIEGDKTE